MSRPCNCIGRVSQNIMLIHDLQLGDVGIQQKLLELNDDIRVHVQSVSHIAAVMTFIEHNCQTFSIRSSRLTAVKCQIPRKGTGNFPGNNSISWRHFSCYKEEDILLDFSTFSPIGRSRSRPYFWQMSTRGRPGRR